MIPLMSLALVSFQLEAKIRHQTQEIQRLDRYRTELLTKHGKLEQEAEV